MINEDGLGSDNGTRPGAAAVIRQPELSNSHPPEGRMTEGSFPRDAVEDHANSESEWPGMKSKGQQQPSSTATWIPTQLAKQQESRLKDRKSHPKSVLECSRRRSSLLHFMPNIDFSTEGRLMCGCLGSLLRLLLLVSARKAVYV